MKPKSQTWEKYVYGEEYAESRAAEIHEGEFPSEIDDEVLQILVNEMDVEEWMMTPKKGKC